MVLNHPKIFREILKLIHKFQFNFGVRSIVNSEIEGLVDEYFQGLYNLTMISYQYQGPTKATVIQELMAFMNNIW